MNYLLLSDENYIRGTLENIKASVQNKEIVDITERGMNAMLQNPGMIAFLCLRIVFINFYSILILIFLSWLAISFYTEKWISILQMYYSMCSTVAILIIGAIMDSGLKYLTYSSVSWFEFGAYLDYFSLDPLIKKLSGGYNLFIILTIVTFSKFASIDYKEKFTATFYLVNLSWILMLLVSYLLRTNIALI